MASAVSCAKAIRWWCSVRGRRLRRKKATRLVRILPSKSTGHTSKRKFPTTRGRSSIVAANDNPAQRFQVDRLRFPGMQLREILIWKNWLYQNSTRFDRYEYNVRLGSGVDPGPSYPDSSRRMWIANSMKRADVVAVKAGRATIIEVEENPGLTAFGQSAGYLALWRQRVAAGGPPAATR